MPHFANAYQKQSMVAPKTASYNFFSLYSPDYSPQLVIAAIPSAITPLIHEGHLFQASTL